MSEREWECWVAKLERERDTARESLRVAVEALEDIVAHDNGLGSCAPAMQMIASAALASVGKRE